MKNLAFWKPNFGMPHHPLIHFDVNFSHRFRREEAHELGEAVSKEDVAWEAADVMYFVFVAMIRAGVTLSEGLNHFSPPPPSPSLRFPSSDFFFQYSLDFS